MNTFQRHVMTGTRDKQRGAILISVLAILIVLTMLGIAATRSTTLEERMAGNFQEKYVAFQAAEAAARVAENALDDKTQRDAMPFDGTKGTYNVTESAGAVDPLSAFKSSATTTVPVTVAGVATGTAYYIERLPERALPNSSIKEGPQKPPSVQMYRVTARGYGRSGITEVIVQTTWAL